MNQELGPIQRLIEFLYSIGLPPMRILRGLIALVLIGLVVGALYFVGFSDMLKSAPREVVEVEGEDEDGTREPVDDTNSPRTTYEFELSLDQQIEELFYSTANDSNYVIVAGEIENQRQKIETLKKRNDLTDEHKFKLDRILLRNEQTLLERKLAAKIHQDSDIDAFREFVQKLVNKNDPKLKDLAGFALVNAGTLVFGVTPNNKNSAKVIEAYETNKFAYIENLQRAQSVLARLRRAKELDGDNPVIDATIEAFGKQLGDSKTASVKLLSTEIVEDGLFNGFGILNLQDRIRYKSPEALQNLDDALRVLEAHPEVDISKWKLLIRSYEPALGIDQASVFETGWKIMNSLVQKLPDADKRKSELNSSLELQLKRAKLIGTQVDTSGDLVTGGQLKPTADNVLMIFTDRGRRSIELMGELRNSVLAGGQFYSPIVSFKDDFSEADMQQLDQIPRGIQISSFATANKLAEAFAIDHYPYTVLLDKQKTVIEVDLSLVQAANRIAALRSDKSAASATMGSTDNAPE